MLGLSAISGAPIGSLPLGLLAPSVSGVTVSPSSATSAQTFSATVAGSNSPSQAVTWSCTAGTINSSGAFTPPATTSAVQTITVTATSVLDSTKSGAATVTIAAVSQGNTSPTVTQVVVSPSGATIDGGATLAMSAQVLGSNSPAQEVTWGISLGSINASGVVTAPAGNGSIQSITVTATSAADPSKSGSASINVAKLDLPPSLGQARLLTIGVDGKISGDDYEFRGRKAYIDKVVGARLVYGFDVAALLAEEGTTLLSATVTPVGVAADSRVHVVGTAVLVWIIGGLLDDIDTPAPPENHITIHYKFANGSEDERTIYFNILPY